MNEDIKFGGGGGGANCFHKILFSLNIEEKHVAETHVTEDQGTDYVSGTYYSECMLSSPSLHFLNSLVMSSCKVVTQAFKASLSLLSVFKL